MTLTTPERYVHAARLEEIEAEGRLVVEIKGQTIALFRHEGQIYAVDNRCPHMGFPLHQGSLNCGILTCHWHHARFDLASGGTFDPWADDVRSFPTRIENGEIWIDVAPPAQAPIERYRARLDTGLQHNLRLVIAKAVIGLQAAKAPDTVALEIGANFGTRYARDGWQSGLTILTALANILPWLKPEDRPRALYQGLTHVSSQTAGQPPAFLLDPLPTTEARPEVFKRWFREFVEVRNRDGAERALRTAIAIGLPMREVADMVFAAATDHLYYGGGHTLDFVNKAFELLDLIGWEYAEQVLPSLVPQLTRGQRSEELSSWRHPVDLAQMLWDAYEELPALMAREPQADSLWDGRSALVETLLTGNPETTIRALLAALAAGVSYECLSGAVVFAAARRIAHFRTSNEFGDWITVLHTFTYANAVHQALRRAPSVELLRGVFDAAISVFLDRFLNMPPAPLPKGDPEEASCGDLSGLLARFDSQQQVNEVAKQVVGYLSGNENEGDLLAVLGHALLREDAEFHTFQVVEAGFQQYKELRGIEDGKIVLLAVARYLAAHSPTPRATGQTYQIALRMQHDEALYEE